jgi:uncharacterized protein YbjQ (UPF0145 family)/ribosomal protein L37E
MSQRGKKSRDDIAREYMIAHGQQVAADVWQCRRCGRENDLDEEFCAQCGADGSGAPRVPRTTQPDTQPVLIVTMGEIPGYRITEVHGDVFGLVVRARGLFGNLGAQLTTVAGGEVTGYTRLLADSRNQARDRMWRQARARGANAVVAMRFDGNEIGGVMSEVVAYGTAVTVQPDAATSTESYAAG